MARIAGAASAGFEGGRKIRIASRDSLRLQFRVRQPR
jgi:hypothetical protein